MLTSILSFSCDVLYDSKDTLKKIEPRFVCRLQNPFDLEKMKILVKAC